jgi:formate-dependent phosphoribosylglycinamide formyltransferase (GAR transformylase)
MTNVVFAAPYFLEATARFVTAVASLPGVRLGLVSVEPEERLPKDLRARLAQHWRVDDGLDPGQLAWAVEEISRRIGRVDRLIGTLEELQVPLAEVRERFGIPGLAAETARNFRDKSRMKDVLRSAGLPCAQHRLCETAQQCWEFVQGVGFPIVVKPPAGAGARNTFRVDAAEPLGEWLTVSPPRPGQAALLEEFILGDEFSYDSVTIGGNTIWSSISCYTPGPLEVQENAWIQWCVLLPRDVSGSAFAQIGDAGPRALAELGLDTGLTHMEWFRRRNGSIAISEVAVRPPGAQFTSLISYAHDFDLYRAWARLMIHETFVVPERAYACGAAYLRGQGDGDEVAVEGWERVRADLGTLVVEAKLPRVGQPRSTSYEGDGFVIVRDPSTEVVENALKRVVESVRVQLG